jgi:hypothetical protein
MVLPQADGLDAGATVAGDVITILFSLVYAARTWDVVSSCQFLKELPLFQPKPPALARYL